VLCAPRAQNRRLIGLECRQLFWAFLAAIAVTLTGSAWAVVTLAYMHGGVNLGG